MLKRMVLISMTIFTLCLLPLSFGQKPPARKAPAKKPPAAQLHVTGVHLTVDPLFRNYKGACPVMVLFNGSITANAIGAVHYTWENSSGTHYNQYAVNFAGPGTMNLRQLHWKVSDSFSGWAALKPLPPHNYISSTRAFFKINYTGRAAK